MLKLILKPLREGLGRLVILADFMTRPSQIERAPADQERINKEAASLSLYQFYACPFCIKTRRAIRRLNIPMTFKSAQEPDYRQELLNGGGEVKVPCLQITDGETITWMYESSEIIDYLNQRFSSVEAA